MWKFQDARTLTDMERKNLSRLMCLAFCDLRALALHRCSQQAKDLAEAFHNLPLLMLTDDFSFKAFQDSRERYQQKHQSRARYNYLHEWEKLTGNASAQ